MATSDVEQSLPGKVAIVTGGSSGIGASIAKHLATAGVKVALVARREDQLEIQQKLIEESGGVACSFQCDVTDRRQVREMVVQVEKKLGPVFILVNCAGVVYVTMMKNLKEDQWERQIDVNCKGVLNCIGAVLDGMIKRGAGHIVNISSDAGKRGHPGTAVYCGTKFFLEGLSQGMRLELVKTGVKVTSIQPGVVNTDIFKLTTDMEALESHGTYSAKLLEADDVGRAVLYAVNQPSYVAVNEILIEPREIPK